METSRRDFAKLTLAGLTIGSATAGETKFKGVRIGVGSYTFRTMPLDDVIKIMVAANAGGIELDAPFVEPAQQPREALRKWRLTVPLEDIKAVRTKLNKAGITVNAYSVPVNDTFTDEEIERVLLITKTLGTNTMNSSTTMAMAKRIAPLAAKHKMYVGLHPSGNPTNPDAIGSAASYVRLFVLSPYIMANLDLSGYKNWGPDPLAFVKEHNKRITSIHFHDRKTNSTPQAWVPFGEGDAPTKELLLLARKEKFKFAFAIERMYNFQGLDQLTEIKKCLDYCHKVLST